MKANSVNNVTKYLWNRWIASRGYHVVNDADTLDNHHLEGYWDFSYHILNPVIKYVTPISVVLEIGCGFGRLTAAAARFFKRVCAIDISRVAVETCLEYLQENGISNVDVRECDGSTIPFDDGHFDLCYSFLVFQHLPSREMVGSYVKEIHRVLKPGGIARIQLRRGSLFGGKDYKQIDESWTMDQGCTWTKWQARKLFVTSGFEVVSIGGGTRKAWQTEISRRQLWVTAQKR